MSTHQITWTQWTVLNETIASERLRSKQLCEQVEALTKENKQLSQGLKILSEELFKNERDLTKGYSK